MLHPLNTEPVFKHMLISSASDRSGHSLSVSTFLIIIYYLVRPAGVSRIVLYNTACIKPDSFHQPPICVIFFEEADALPVLKKHPKCFAFTSSAIRLTAEWDSNPHFL